MTARNVRPDRYREVAVAEVDVPLTEAALAEHLLGREAYRRTRFIVARRGEGTALVRVAKASSQPLFSPITAVELLAGPDECRLVDAPEIDTAVATQLAAVARSLHPMARCVVVRGRYGHLSFLLDPEPLRIRVVETVPPLPAKLLDQLRRVLEIADDLPPIELEPVLVELPALARSRPASHYLFPCRAGEAAVPGARLDYLDQRPSRGDWVLVGCTRSREIHRWCYGDDPLTVDACPRALATGQLSRGAPTLTKCCLFEQQIAVDGTLVTVPWGASMTEVKDGVVALVGVMEQVWAPE